MEGAGRELVRLLLTDERLEDAILAGAREGRVAGVVYGGLDHQVMLRGSGEWQVGEEAGQGRGRQAGQQ